MSRENINTKLCLSSKKGSWLVGIEFFFFKINAVLKILTFVGLFETINLCVSNLSEAWSISRYHKKNVNKIFFLKKLPIKSR